MKRFLLTFCLLALLCLPAAAADQIITATITVTNPAGTTNGQTITVNSDLRTWTNSVVFPASQILTNNSIGGCATNLYLAVAASRFANLSLGQLTNGITLQTAPNGALMVSLSPGWGLVVLTTNTLTDAIVLRLPITVEIPSVQTNLATWLAQAFESSTYSISAGSPALANLLNLSQAQTVSGRKTFISLVVTNELSTNGFYVNPTLTNGVNYGNAFSSPVAGFGNTGAEQFGAGASASGLLSTAFGYVSVATSAGLAVGAGAKATNTQATAVGNAAIAGAPSAVALGTLSTATASNSIAIGANSVSSGTNSTAVGVSATATGINSTAVGQGASAANNNSTAIGQGASTTADNQVLIGQATQSTIIPGGLQAGTISNASFALKNNFPAGSDIAFGRNSISSLANGNNAAVVVGTNIFCDLSGPSGAFTINGIAGGRDGKFIILENRTGQNMTIAHDSGVDPTAANRIYTLTAADKTVTGNSAAMLIYNATSSRWILLNFTQ